MGKKKTRFTDEFKLSAVQLVTKQGYSQKDAAERLGIEAKNLSCWIALDKTTGLNATNTKIKLPVAQQELEQLRKEIKRLKMEREILKKAAAFFANESN